MYRVIIESADRDWTHEDAQALAEELLSFDTYGDGSLTIRVEEQPAPEGLES